MRETSEACTSAAARGTAAAATSLPDDGGGSAPLRTWIVDDEELARERLRLLLRHCPSVQVIAEFSSAQAALPQVPIDQPDLIFLDVKMPGLNGMEFATLLRDAYRTAIVFVTAFDEFAVPAFSVAAVDYLVKPFDRERLLQAVTRAQEWTGRMRVLPARDAEQATPVRSAGPGRIAVRMDGQILFVPLADIEWIEAANNYLLIHLANGKRLIVRMTLVVMEQRLPAERFLRVNRSSLVNTEHVVALKPTVHGDYALVLRNRATLRISRSRRSELLHLVKSGGDLAASEGLPVLPDAPGVT